MPRHRSRLPDWTTAVATTMAMAVSIPALLPAQMSEEPRHPVTIAIGFGEGALSGPGGRDASGGFNVASVGYEHALGARRSIRGEVVLGQKGGFVTGANTAVAAGVADGLVTMRTLQMPLLARYYTGSALFLSAGGSVGFTIGCDVDQEDVAETFFGRSVTPCAEWTGVPFQYYVEDDGEVGERPKVFTRRSHEGSLIVSAGFSIPTFDLEVRYDHALSPALRSASGGLRTRTLTMLVHWRPAGPR